MQRTIKIRGWGVAYTDHMPDYPDWQSYPTAQSDNLFPDYTQTLPPGLNKGTVLPALSWSSILMMASPTAGAGQLQITHYADAAATQPIDSDTWPVNATTRVVVRSPLRGKYVRLDYTVTSATDLTVNNWANFLSATSDRISYPVAAQNLSDFDHSLAPGAVATYDIGEIAGGQAFFYVKPYDNAGKLDVVMFAVDELGNSGQLICDFGGPTAILRQQLAVPDTIIRVQVTNTGASTTRSYDFSLTIPPQ